jgi:aryl-alcohol dehydrogenase-like predicted oxidoreductase
MEYRYMGKTKMSELCLGTMTFGREGEASEVTAPYPHDFIAHAQNNR